MDFFASEVLEGILLELPLKDLLCLQRVCRRWKDLISQSPTLQKNLFFQPVSNKNSKPELNPLLQSLFPLCFELTTIPNNSDGFTYGEHIQQLGWWQDVDRRNTTMRPEASWRRMLPVQPPAKIDQLIEEASCKCDQFPYTDSMPLADVNKLQSDGASMGMIFGLLVQYVDDWDAGFHIQWHMFLHPDTDTPRQHLEQVEMASNSTHLENKLTMRFRNSTGCFESEPPSQDALANPSRLKLSDIDIKGTRYF